MTSKNNSNTLGGLVELALGRKRKPANARRPKAIKNELNGRSRHLFEAATLDSEALLHSLNTSQSGLSGDEARRRLKEYGTNEVAHGRPPSWQSQLLGSFKNPFIILLVILSGISYLTDDLKAATIITLMVVASVLLRFFQEFRSVAAAERLKSMVSSTATVSRVEKRRPEWGPRTWKALLSFDFHRCREIPLRDLVPGDVVHLSAGDMVPADVRLLGSKDLFISQAVLTGESMPVEKSDTLCPPEKTQDPTSLARKRNFLEVENLAFLGTNVISGTATAVVIATGKDSYLGTISKSLVGHRVPTGFDRGLNDISWLLIRFMLAMVPLVFLLNGLSKGIWLMAFFFSVSVAVGLTPEMLPMIVSANLSRGAIAMSRKRVIVKKLGAIQNLGVMDILCTDKTGTLTEDRVVLERHLDVLGAESESVLRYSYLNSLHQTGLKNLLDLAILKHVELGKRLDAEGNYHKVDEMPFDFTRRRMSVVVERDEGEHILICKGAVEEIFKVCATVEVNGEIIPVDGNLRRHVTRVTNELNEEGLRVIAVAIKRIPTREVSYTINDEAELTLVGYLAFLDPPKKSTASAVEALRAKGIRVIVLTGDSHIVARKVCKDVGIDVEYDALGSEIELISDEELGELAERATVFAKLNPMQKSRIIRALRSRGHTVGYLGDGINDAPALRDSDVGISVDTAVDIAKESADIILLEKDLLVLEAGVIEGRKTSLNIIKYIKTATSSNFGNMISVLGASILLPFLPMMPLHLLVQNLLYDLSQVFIPFDDVDQEDLDRPKAWDTRDIGRFMVIFGPISSLFDYATFFLMWSIFHADSIAHQAEFQSGWFVEGLLSQVMIVHMIRTAKVPFLQSRASWPLILMTLIVMAVGLIIPSSGLGARIGLVPLPWSYFFPWLLIILVGYFFLAQVVKAWYIRRFSSWLGKD
jgi:P-type Mg2+ transporter